MTLITGRYNVSGLAIFPITQQILWYTKFPIHFLEIIIFTLREEITEVMAVRCPLSTSKEAMG